MLKIFEVYKQTEERAECGFELGFRVTMVLSSKLNRYFCKKKKLQAVSVKALLYQGKTLSYIWKKRKFPKNFQSSKGWGWGGNGHTQR